MPITKLHKTKRTKNFAVLAAIVCFMLIIFAVTVIRLKAGIDAAG